MSGYNLNKLSVLIVDDHESMLRILKVMLRGIGIETIVAALSGQDAVDKMRTFDPDFIILDHKMEPIDGLELTRMIRLGDTGANPYVPIIMVTGHSSQANVIMAMDAGINEYLAKPLSVKMLYARLIRVIEHPQPFIRSHDYFGPDRRHKQHEYSGPEKRLVEYFYRS